MKIKSNLLEKMARIERVTNRETDRAENAVKGLKALAETVANAETGKSEKAICKQFAKLYTRAAAIIEKAITDGETETDETETDNA